MTRGGVLGRLLTVVAALAGATGLVLLLTAPAQADGEVVVSADGSSWSAALASPLFATGDRWVPGDTRTASFWIGNRAADAGDVAVVATADDGAGLVARRDITLQARRASGTWVDLPADGAPHPLPGAALAAGADEEVEVRASFDPASANVSQLRRLPLAFQVVLSRSTSVVAPPDDDPDHGGGDGGGHGGLPDTGGVDLRLLITGLLLLVVGSTVVGSTPYLATRKKDDHDHEA